MVEMFRPTFCLLTMDMKRISGPVYFSGEIYVSRMFVPPMPIILTLVVILWSGIVSVCAMPLNGVRASRNDISRTMLSLFFIGIVEQIMLTCNLVYDLTLRLAFIRVKTIVVVFRVFTVVFILFILFRFGETCRFQFYDTPYGTGRDKFAFRLESLAGDNFCHVYLGGVAESVCPAEGTQNSRIYLTGKQYQFSVRIITDI